jgi:hypothetical protein
MTNHDRFASVFRKHAGEEFTSVGIKRKMLDESDIAEGSIRPNDHAEGNASPCGCAKNKGNKPLFDRIGPRLYRVRGC